MGLVNYREELHEANMMDCTWVTPSAARVQNPHLAELNLQLSKIEEENTKKTIAKNLKKRTLPYRLRNIERYAYNVENKMDHLSRLEKSTSISRNSEGKPLQSESEMLESKIKKALRRTQTLDTILKAYRSNHSERVSIVKALASHAKNLDLQIRKLRCTILSS